jgi:GNAT superfamily N-acetyltransferase
MGEMRMGENRAVRHVLDDPAWHALTGPLAPFAHGHGAVRRISVEHSIFTAIDPDAALVDVVRDLASTIVAGERFVLVGADPVVPAGFDELGRGQALQMVLDDVDLLHRTVAAVHERASGALEVAQLHADDVPEMLALVDHARPGPFLARTIELGNYVGVRADGVLVAMAGERLRPPGHVEVSAVSTHDSHRRRGLASVVVGAVADAAIARGDTPFLHVVTTNVTAIPVYERLGFRTRATVSFVAAVRPEAST